MTKSYYLILGFILFALVSCSQDSDGDIAGEKDNISIRVNLPDDIYPTRMGENSSSNILLYAIYEVEDNNLIYLSQGTSIMGNEQTVNLNLQLIKGNVYKIAFFAMSEFANENGIYSFNTDDSTNTISVDYSAMSSEGNNSDLYDCYYNVTADLDFSKNSTELNITLYRPVAQINWGTDDLNSDLVSEEFGENGVNIQTVLKANLYTVFNFFTGEYEGEAESVEIGPFSIPYGNNYPVKGYQYVALQYLLGVPSSTTVDLTLEISNAVEPDNVIKTIEVSDVRIQSNFQTNLYGSLLTSTLEDTEISDSK